MTQKVFRHSRRILSVMLTLVLLATTFFIFNPSLLKAKAAFAVWDGTYRTTSPTHTDQLMGTYKSAGFVSKNNTTKVIEISDPKALILFGNMISKEGWCREWTVKLTNDIDLNGYAGSNTKWPGFGRYITDRCFEGTFDGQGHTIKNMVTEANYGNGTDNLGFFGALKGATIKNITFENCTVGPSSMSGEAHGVVAGYNTSGTVTFENVTVTNSKVYGSRYIGGILGKSDGQIEMINCKNLYSPDYESTACNLKDYFVKSNYGTNGYSGVGGLVGYVSDNKTTFTNCTNSAYVCMTDNNNYAYRIGGLVGYAKGEVYVINSNNYGAVGDPNNRKGLTAGFIGNAEKYVSISDSNNYGTISGKDTTGGFIGWHDNAYNIVVSNSSNYGNVSGTAEYVGGLIGLTKTSKQVKFTNTANYGNVSGVNSVGGFVGKYNDNDEIYLENCKNKGNVSGSDSTIGGFVGHTNGKITAKTCMNTGNVYTTSTSTGQENTAGFVAYIDDDASTFTECFNYGTITGCKSVGGIVGKFNASSTIQFNYCANLGEIASVHASASDTHGAGILGWFGGSKATFISCFNGNGVRGNVGTTSKKFSRAGGLVGWASTADFKYCYNNAPIIGATYTGGIIAETNTGTSIQYSYNAGSLNGANSSNTGTLAGKNNPSSTLNSYYLSSATYPSSSSKQGTSADDSTFKSTQMPSKLNSMSYERDSLPYNQGYPILKYTTVFTQNITFKNYNGAVLESRAWPYISVPAYKGATPVRASDDNYQYTFKEFTPAFAEVTEDAEYTATYNEIPHNYEWVSISDTHHHYICKDCGYVKTNTVLGHETVWQFADETGHWQHCTVCGYETAKTAHGLEYKSDASQHWQECTICDYATDKESHSLERLYTESGHYDYCDTCKYTSTTVSHNLLDDYDENGHWKYCSDCDYETTPVTHTLGYVADDSQHWKECSDCDYATAKVDHELTEKFDTDQHWKSCDVCGLYETTKVDHSLKNAYNDDQHWQKCTGCAYETEKEDHTLSLKTYADFHRDECDCGYKTNQQSHTVTVYSDDIHHWFVSDDGCGYKSAEYDHQSKQVINETQHYLYCETCTRSYNYQDHNFVLLDNVFDADTHTYKCAGCPKEKKEEHVFTDASGKCQICNYSQDDLADYTNVIAALDKIPSENEIKLFIENDANYELLKLTVASIKWNYKSAEQMKVNALAKSIEDAIDGLTIKTYPVNGLGVGSVTYKKTASTNHYMLATVTAPIKNGAGEYFSYWVNEKGEVTSTYLNYTFYSVAERTLTPVYGKTLTEADYVSSYVAGVRDNLDGTHSILVEHSASQKVEINGHGVLFTYDSGKVGSLVLGAGANGTYNPVAAVTASTRTGLFEVTITAPSDASNIYLKPYVTNMTTGETVYGADASFGLGGLASQSIDVLSITELTIDEDSVEPSATDDVTADEPITMPDYQLTIWEQIVAFILSIWKYLMSLLAF